MSPAAENKKAASGKSDKLGGKEFEETFKPKKGAAAKELEEPKAKGKGKGKKEKKNKKKGPKLIIIIIAIVLLLGGSVAALYLSGNLTKALSMVGLGPPPTYAGPTVDIEAEQKALEKKAADLAAKEQTLNELQAKLDKQKAAKASAAASPSASPTFESYRAGLSDQKLAELKQVGSIYSKMDPAAAADIMKKIYDPQQIAVIVYYMTPAASALVLAKLDTAISASVTKLLTS